MEYGEVGVFASALEDGFKSYRAVDVGEERANTMANINAALRQSGGLKGGAVDVRWGEEFPECDKWAEILHRKNEC